MGFLYFVINAIFISFCFVITSITYLVDTSDKDVKGFIIGKE